MNFRDLQYFVAVAENRHFGRAADQCFVSQPTLSMQLKKLEQELDVQLFERDKKQVRLTHAGQKVLGQAETVLREMQALKSAARLASDPLSGDFKIGVIPTLAPYLLPYIAPDMKKQFSRVKFYLFEHQTHELLELMQKGRLDLALLALPVSGSFESRELFKELFYLMMPHNHPLSKEKKVGIDQIDPQELLLLSDGHCLRDQALAACGNMAEPGSKGLSFSATSLETLRHMITLGNGVTLMPELSLTIQGAAHEVAIKPLKDPRPFRTIGMIWRASSSHSELITRLGDFITERMKDKLKFKL
jgi:LysR family hydrogen peroxide-inducible transcriptional activator